MRNRPRLRRDQIPQAVGGILAQGELSGKDMRGHLWNVVFKVPRYAPGYPGLAERDLTPKGVIELSASQKGKTGLDGMTEQQRPDRPNCAAATQRLGGHPTGVASGVLVTELDSFRKPVQARNGAT